MTSNCNDDESPMPATDRCFDRDSKISCLIDGIYWESTGGGGFNPRVEAYYDDWNHALTLTTKNNSDNTFLRLTILNNLDTIGINYLNGPNDISYIGPDDVIHNTDINYDNIVDISVFDSSRECIEVSFKCRVISEDLLDTVLITEGFFTDKFETN